MSSYSECQRSNRDKDDNSEASSSIRSSLSALDLSDAGLDNGDPINKMATEEEQAAYLLDSSRKKKLKKTSF